MMTVPRRIVLLVATSAFSAAVVALAVLGVGRQTIGSPAAAVGLTLPVVAGAGLLDGFNPCSFAGLVLFASFTLKAAQGGGETAPMSAPAERRRRLLGNGLTYVSAIFLVYLALGLGFLAAVNLLSASHAVGRAAAVATVVLGLWSLKDALIPEWGWRLEVPGFLRPMMRDALRATTPAAIFAGGILVGLCTVPCTGGIYLGVLSLLAGQSTYGTGVAYLLVYNLTFVTPLLAVLALATSRRALGRLARWPVSHGASLKTALGAAMVALGLLSLGLLA